MSDKHPFTDGVTDINPWHPEADPVRLAALGKLAEELTEAASRVSRCIIQGIDELDPESGRSNRDELGREMADIRAAFNVLLEEAGPVEVSDLRSHNKSAGFRNWFGLIRPRQES